MTQELRPGEHDWIWCCDGEYCGDMYCAHCFDNRDWTRDPQRCPNNEIEGPMPARGYDL